MLIRLISNKEPTAKPSGNFPSAPENKPMFNEGQLPKQYPPNIADVLHEQTKLMQQGAQQGRNPANFPPANLLKG